MTLKKIYVTLNMIRQWDLISTCVPPLWVFLENSCQDFLFVLPNEMSFFVSPFSCEAGSHITEQYMTGQDFLHLIYITCGEFLLRLLPVREGNICHSLVI